MLRLTGYCLRYSAGHMTLYLMGEEKIHVEKSTRKQYLGRTLLI